MRTRKINIQVHEFDNLEKLPESCINLLKKAREAAENAYAPYSEFFVGAAVLLENGEIITGNNQENAAYPSGLCAERVALFYASANFPETAVKKIAITALSKDGRIVKQVTPCGACRQVLLEVESKFKKSVEIILDGEKILIFDGVENLLPFGFRPVSLKEEF